MEHRYRRWSGLPLRSQWRQLVASEPEEPTVTQHAPPGTTDKLRAGHRYATPCTVRRKLLFRGTSQNADIALSRTIRPVADHATLASRSWFAPPPRVDLAHGLPAGTATLAIQAEEGSHQ